MLVKSRRSNAENCVQVRSVGSVEVEGMSVSSWQRDLLKIIAAMEAQFAVGC